MTTSARAGRLLVSAALALWFLGCSGKERDFGGVPAVQTGAGSEGPATAEVDPLPSGGASASGGSAAAGTGEALGNVGLAPPAEEAPSGGGPAQAAVDAGVADIDGPSLTSEIEQADLGNAEEGTTGSTFTWLVTNRGRSSTANLNLVQTGADFLITNGCTGSLGAGSSCSITLTFAPQAGGLRSVTLALGDGQAAVTLLAVGNAQVRLTIDRRGVGAVTSAQGINCGETCSALFNVGDQVTLQAATTNGSDSFFSGWSAPACVGPARSCSVEMTARQTLTATFSPMLNNLIFFSSENFSADLGGVLPYDAACNRMATAAGINNTQGTGFVAMLSDSTSNVRDRFDAGVQGWVRLDGRPFTTSLTDLFDESAIYTPAIFDENGLTPFVESLLNVMTGTENDGSVGTTCNDWSTLDPEVQGVTGSQFGGPITWSFFGGQACSVPRHLFCLGNTKSAPLQLQASTGKRIWVTAPTYLVGAGVSPDAACFADRPAGVATARALIAYTDSPAADVIQPDATYVRPDGQLVATGQQLFDRQITTGIWQASDGTFQAPANRAIIVPTGTERLTDLGTPESTCNDWTDPAGTKTFGAFAFANRHWWFRDIERTCDEAVALYCLEE